MTTQDSVFLIPGFLGFERVGNFANFADRVVSALRTSLEQRLDRSVPVIPISSLPTDSLAQRQRALLQTIGGRVAELGGVERIHLVGHSVGGIDAHLLACAHTLDGEPWTSLDVPGAAATQAKICSVTTIASPHQGTSLAAARGAGAFTPGALLRDPAGAAEMGRLVVKLLASAWGDVNPADLRASLGREGRKVSHFVGELRNWQDMLSALTPPAMEALQQRARPLPNVQRRSFVTLSGRPRVDSGMAGPDPLFRELSRRTAGVANGFKAANPEMRAGLELLRAALLDPRRVIRHPAVDAPVQLDHGSNDGVANASRQLMNVRDPSELAAVVLADHFDVLGYYDRSIHVTDARGRDSRREVVTGLLHSGSHFRDEQFFELYRRVADCIVGSLSRTARVETGAAAKSSAVEPHRDRPTEKLRRPRTRRADGPAAH